MKLEKRSIDWREWLVDSERAEIARLEAKIEKATASVKPLRAERNRIANRALQRAKYAAKPR